MDIKKLLESDEHDSIEDFELIMRDQSVEDPANADVVDLMTSALGLTELVTDELSDDQLNSLISAERDYGLGLRIILLRTLLHTKAANALMTVSGFGINRVLEFLGFTNFARFAKERTYAESRVTLVRILRDWETQHGDRNWFPSALQANLDDLAAVVELDETDKMLLGFSVLLHAEPLLEHCTDLMGSELSGVSVHIPLAHILNVKTAKIESALSQEGKLHSSGLLTIDLRGRSDLKQLLDLLTPTLHSRMTVRQNDIRNVVAGFVKPASTGALAAENYEYVSGFYKLVCDYLRAAFSTGKKGANILIYGAPGTGKSQLARAVANEINVELMEISPTNLAGDAITPMRRLRSYGIAQAFYRSKGYTLLFDEIEEVLAAAGCSEFMGEPTIAQKSFLNALLENNHTPAIWIANDISEFDPAHIRRFDICIEMPVPPLSVRLGMLKEAFSEETTISEALLNVIAKSEIITPALIQQAATVTAMVAKEQTESAREKMVVNLLNEKLRAQGARALNYNASPLAQKKAFDPTLVNCQANLAQMAHAMGETRSARLCLYGPPGTGKTAFGKWVAQALDLPHMVVTASSLLSKYIGETEKNIAAAFERARRDGAVLQFDEVDTFLRDRRHARHQFEVSKVNEMLVQMENFDGIFIASTNLVDNLDEASLRRFDMAVKFDFITPEAAKAFFQHACTVLGLDGNHAPALARMNNLHCLTPGDFDQVLRRTRLTGVKDEHALVDALEAAVALKKSAPRPSIGFLKAA